LTGIGDVRAQGGEEIESGPSGCGRGIPVGAAIMIFGMVDDRTGLPVIIQASQSNGGMDTISGQAFSCLMIVRGDAVALKYGKPGMAPGKKDVNQALADLFLCQQRLQELVAEQQHDLDWVRRRNREKGAVWENQPLRDETVQMRVIPGRIIAIRLD
jgi:hypothetical protein